MLHLEGILPLRTYQNHHQEKLNLPKRHNLKTEKKIIMFCQKPRIMLIVWVRTVPCNLNNWTHFELTLRDKTVGGLAED